MKFSESHYINYKSSLYFGLTVPGPEKGGKSYYTYCFLLLCITFTVFVLFTEQLVQMNSFIRISVDFTGDCTVLYGLVISLYLAKVTKPFKELMKKIEEVTLLCLNDPLDPKKTFFNRMLLDYKPIKIYTIVSVSFTITAAVGFFSLSVIRSMELFGLDGKKIAAVDIWFLNIHKSPNFELSQLTGMIGILVGAMQKQAMECFVLCLLSLLCSYLDHLNFTIYNVFSYDSNLPHSCIALNSEDTELIIDNAKLTESNPVLCKIVQKRLNDWIKIHQKTLSIVSELTVLLSPFLAFYLVNITALVAIAVFSITLGEMQVSQMVSLCLYCACTGLALYLMCRYGTYLKTKNEDVAQPAFWICFKSTGGVNKEVYSSLKIVFQRVIQPLIVSPFKSNSFELSSTSFVSFSWSIISFYLAINKMKALSIK